LIKHISFDLWLTLIKSHPEFKEKRAEFLKQEFNPKSYSVREIMDIIQKTDKVCDRWNEISGKKIPTEWMYRRILLKLGIDQKLVSNSLLMKIKLHINNLFGNFQPIFLNVSTEPLLYSLKNEGYNLNISSNTGFIEGEIISSTLRNLNIARFFDFSVFSDETGVSKPSYGFFEKVFEQTGVEKGEVLHIGDNYKTDYKGALRYGFKALHIKNQQYTINDIKKHIQEND